MIVVADTSPINYLILIDQIHVLQALFGQVVIPGAVHAELLAPRTPQTVRLWPQSMRLLDAEKPNVAAWSSLEPLAYFATLTARVSSTSKPLSITFWPPASARIPY
jgi:hypothetical protein